VGGLIQHSTQAPKGCGHVLGPWKNFFRKDLSSHHTRWFISPRVCDHGHANAASVTTLDPPHATVHKRQARMEVLEARRA
jgi:hypothetical protein